MPQIPGKHAAEAQATRTVEADAAALQLRAAGEYADRLGSRRRRAGVPVRNVFVSSEDPGVRPPMARLLSGAESGGGGRGGQLRLKLFLSLLWVCAKAPYSVTRPARAWAALLGLPDPEGSGTRRIQATFRELGERRLVRVLDRGGRPSEVTVLNEKALGAEYEPPSETYSLLQSKGAEEDVLREHRYFRLPSGLWTAGYINKLSGPGLAMLMVLRCEQRGQEGTDVWFSPGKAADRFSLAETTQRQGLQELRQLGLLVTQKKIVSESGAYIDFTRRRNVHTLNLMAMSGSSLADLFAAPSK